MIPIDLSGKLALVTGATGELGRVMARTLGRAGADVIVHYYSNREQAESLVAELEDLGRNSLAVQADVTEKASVDGMRQAVELVIGLPDIIVNNAVIQYQWTTVLDQSLADYESQFRSCVLHNVLMAKAFTPSMIEKGWGRVIGINTECAMQYWKNQSAYISGKRGMEINAQSVIHQEAIEELGDSFSSEAQPMVVEVEGETHELTGSAESQYEQWRDLMRKIYASETGLEPESGATGD